MPPSAGKRPRLLAVGQHATNSLFIGAVHQGGLTQAHLATGSLLGQDVAQILTTALILAAAGKARRVLILGMAYSLQNKKTDMPEGPCPDRRGRHSALKNIRPQEDYFLGTSNICRVRPSARGSWSTLATSARSCTTRSSMFRPRSLCTISRPRKNTVILQRSPSSRKRRM